MHIYSVYLNNKSQDITPIIIRGGFSIWAPVFNLFWAFYHRIWWLGALVILINIAPIILQPLTPWVFILEIFQLFIFTFFASDILEFQAKRQGMELSDIILANNEEEAEIKFLARKFSA